MRWHQRQEDGEVGEAVGGPFVFLQKLTPHATHATHFPTTTPHGTRRGKEKAWRARMGKLRLILGCVVLLLAWAPR